MRNANFWFEEYSKLLLMEEILHNLGFIYIYTYNYNLVNAGINYLSTDAGCSLSTVVTSLYITSSSNHPADFGRKSNPLFQSCSKLVNYIVTFG